MKARELQVGDRVAILKSNPYVWYLGFGPSDVYGIVEEVNPLFLRVALYLKKTGMRVNLRNSREDHAWAFMRGDLSYTRGGNK